MGLTYDTTYQQMEKFVGRLREYLMHHDGVYDDGITVNFQDFGGSSLDIRIICYTKASAYASFMDVRQQINIDIMKMLEEVPAFILKHRWSKSKPLHQQMPLKLKYKPETKNAP